MLRLGWHAILFKKLYINNFHIFYLREYIKNNSYIPKELFNIYILKNTTMKTHINFKYILLWFFDKKHHSERSEFWMRLEYQRYIPLESLIDNPRELNYIISRTKRLTRRKYSIVSMSWYYIQINTIYIEIDRHRQIEGLYGHLPEIWCFFS